VAGGLDPGCGAGLCRDLLTAAALGARAVLLGTAWTEQGEAVAFEPRALEKVGTALLAALRGTGAARTAVKIGMVATGAIARVLAAALASYGGPVVFDPVLRTSRGGSLYDGDRESLLGLARKATLLTPNLDEAGWLCERPVHTLAEARAAARALRGLGVAAVLVKGGHLADEATDVLLGPAGETLLSGPRIAGPSPRGTGCALATAIAIELASGNSLECAVAAAKSWLGERIAQAVSVGEERHL
jgi:hydroxymethylpyrimidine/phosphomethylpyrimidine kinase